MMLIMAVNKLGNGNILTATNGALDVWSAHVTGVVMKASATR